MVDNFLIMRMILIIFGGRRFELIISWEKIRHQHPKEEWKELLERVECGSSHIFTEKRFWYNSTDENHSYSILYRAKQIRKKPK
ncbi:Uncharacterized protein NV38_0002370 [Leptospira kirschneri serovar Mozdok]|nr:Uncharacterized protein NV38_0002370 [Leptospira kirschneri serovar Mozdok]NDK04227.1 hypothetical protein [Leptospira kirschneri serovar Mozdok]